MLEYWLTNPPVNESVARFVGIKAESAVKANPIDRDEQALGELLSNLPIQKLRIAGRG